MRRTKLAFIKLRATRHHMGRNWPTGCEFETPGPRYVSNDECDFDDNFVCKWQCL